jgi:hypothetical protein
MDLKTLHDAIQRLQREVDDLRRGVSGPGGGGGGPGGGGGRHAAGPPANLFWVAVQKTGGSNGTQTTAASWTYTVREIEFPNSTIGTAIAVTRPRGHGEMDFQAGTTGRGLAYYDANGYLKLWDAGENPALGDCED